MTHRCISRSFLLLIVAVSAMVFLAGCGSSTDTSAKQPSDRRDPALEVAETKPPAEEADKKTDDAGEATTSAATDAEPKQTVKIAGSAFEPATLTIKAGTTVVWLNGEPAEHKVHDDNDAFLSEPVGQDGTFEMKFSAPGTFTYHCHVHPMMKGTIIVE